MKNLLVVADRLSQLSLDEVIKSSTGGASSSSSSSSANPLSAFDFAAYQLDATSGRLFLVTRETMHFFVYSLHSHSITYQCALVTDDLLTEFDRIISLHYLPELELVHLTSYDGNLLTVSPDGMQEPTVVGAINVGIASVAWSPDEELCIIMNRANQIVIMTKEFDVMYEIDIFNPNATAAASSSSSSSATAAALTPDQILALYSRFGYGSISWRGDGQYFVINAFNPYTSERHLIVYDRQAERQSISAGVKAVPLDGLSDGMDSPIVWRPSGNLIFTAAHRTISSDLTKRELWLWERNGLRHGEIALGNVMKQTEAASATSAAGKAKAKKAKKKAADEDDDDEGGDENDYTDEIDESANLDTSIASLQDAYVRDLAWNADSDILAVRLEDKQTRVDSILLYTTSNYHWYVKQEFRATTPGARLYMQWHAEDARRLILIESTGLIRYIDLVWDTSIAPSQSRLATVIDGQSVLLTPLTKCCVPPPMSTWKLSVPVANGRINSVAVRASAIGAAQQKAGTCKFTLPNQALEATAFRHNEASLPQSVVSSIASSSSSPSTSSATLYSPTSDLLLQTADGTLYLLENIEGRLGNTFNSGVRVIEDLGGKQLMCSLKSEDFALGCVRGMEWLENGENEAILNDSTSLTLVSSISQARPAVLLAIESVAGKPDALVELDIYGGEIQGMFRTPLPNNGNKTILRMVQYKLFGSVFLQLADGSVQRYYPAAWQTHLHPDERVPILQNASLELALPCACPWFDIVSLGGTLHSVGRDALGKLYISSQLLTPQCSSFVTSQHPEYMIFSILGQQNAVFLIDKTRSLEDNMSLEFRSDPHNVRLIERGGQLVCIIPSLTLPRLILQMPRGNLEGIYPRNFNLSAINSALSSLKLREALINMRRNKIDSNLIFDHFGFDGFHRIARLFVEQIGNEMSEGQGVEYMNLFLSALTEESSIENQYVKYRPLPLTPEAEAYLAQRDADGSGGSTGRDHAREALMKAVATMRNQAGAGGDDAAAGPAGARDDDVRSDAGSLHSGKGDDNLAPHHAVGEAAPYNYVPRKPGQSRRPNKVKSKAAKEADGAIRKSKEEARRDKEKIDRAAREKLAEEYESSQTKTEEKHSSKVNYICDLLREIFLAYEERHPEKKGRFTLCILTTYLKNEPKNYDAALRMVKQLKDEEKSKTKVASSSSSSASKVGKEQSSLENKAQVYSGYTGALQYMIFLSDITTLYRSALGIYDFELVRLVAQYSHMDPKEYLSFLEKLQAMDPPATSSASSTAATKRQPHFQHYQIDVYLSRWDKALSSLLLAWQTGEIPHDQTHWNLVLDLVKSHPELYVRAIEIVTPEAVRDQTRLVIAGYGGGGGGGRGSMGGSSMYGMDSTPFDPTGGLPAHFLNPSLAPTSSFSHSLMPSSSSGASTAASNTSTPAAPESDELTPYFSLLKSYASHLTASRSSTSVRHAAHAYLLCHEYALALQTLKDAGEWKEALVLAYQLGWKQDAVQQLAHDLAQQLRTETRTTLAAATLLIEYCDDIDEGVIILLNGELWFDILRICYSKQREDLIETHVQPEILKAYARHVKHLQTHRQRYVYAIKRLRVIRRVKLLFPPVANVNGEEGQNDARDDDLMSIVSGRTASTSYSSASASLSEASAFSGRSTSTVASTSSIFSIQSDDRRELTPDEKRIARHQAKLKRLMASKRVKEGSIYEEGMMTKEVIETTPLEKHKERISELIHALLHFGYIDQSRTLQHEFSTFMRIVAEEEATPMPMLENPTPEQRAALIAYWNWPQLAHPERSAPPKTDHLTMPFLFPRPSTIAQQKKVEQEEKDKQTGKADPTAQAVRSGPQPRSLLDQADDDDGDLLGMMMG